ncbi:MAG: acyl-CoA dehydrogenase family protein [Deltaproteobacteria bacterium]|nr:acyl-CoA dehydrogenase family protein [Deltaproteobacteria bacterium]
MERGFLTEEHIIFRDNFRKFIAQEITPHTEEWEENRQVSRDVWLKMGEQGYLCPWLDEKYGGCNAGFEYSVIITEELAYANEVGLAAGLHNDMIVPYIDTFGNEEQKMKWLPGCTTGEILTAVAMTEPNAGSDLAAIRTTAVRNGNGYIVNGQKTFISNGISCDIAIVAVKTDPKAGAKGISLLVVEDGTPGFSKGRKLKKMGAHSQDTAELYFEDCTVSASNLLGEENKGFFYLMHQLAKERLLIAATAQSMAEGMLDATMKYCKERTVFGKPVSSYQYNAFKLVDMATEVELGRAFVDSLIVDYLAGKDILKKVSMAKSWICEMSNRVAYDGVQLHGGYGYMDEYPICRFARNARVNTIVGGTTEVMKVILSRMMGL